MSKIITDEKSIEEFLTRGVENIYPNKEFLKKQLLSGKKLTMYLGIDPTGPTLHLGHTIPIKKLGEFQKLGHKAILLIGDFTAMIGDPTDKGSARKPLTRSQVLNNCKLYKKQISTFLNFGFGGADLKYNSKWLGKMKFADVLDLASKMTVDQMLKRDMFQKRIEEKKPLYIHEFMYPLMQGYDSVAMDVDGEIGGNDQTFNMLAGRDLMKEINGKEKFVMTVKLLADSTGKKMGKTEGNMASLTDDNNEMFGKVMSWTDGVMISAFELCTNVPMDEIKQIENDLVKGLNPKESKLKLAYEIVRIYYGDIKAKEAMDEWQRTFSQKEIPTDIETIKPTQYDILTVLVESKISPSKSEARRNIEQKGVRVNNIDVSDDKLIVKSGDIIQKGKRFFIKII
ncbi:MAG: tyrosine--tRNA ligase [bacterium]